MSVDDDDDDVILSWDVTLLGKGFHSSFKQFHSSGGTSTSWACSWIPPATKLMSHRLAGRSTPLHQQQEKHDLQLLTEEGKKKEEQDDFA